MRIVRINEDILVNAEKSCPQKMSSLVFTLIRMGSEGHFQTVGLSACDPLGLAKK